MMTFRGESMSELQGQIQQPSIVISKLEMALVGYVAKYGFTEDAREALAESEEYEEMTSVPGVEVLMMFVRE